MENTIRVKCISSLDRLLELGYMSIKPGCIYVANIYNIEYYIVEGYIIRKNHFIDINVDRENKLKRIIDG